MKLSPQTIVFLKNFTTINAGIILKPGNILGTTNPEKTAFGVATIDENFPVEAPIASLGEFLSSLNMFGNYELEFLDNLVKIHEMDSTNARTGSFVRYVYSQAKIITPPATALPLTGLIASFALPRATLEQLLRSHSVLKLDYMTITCTEGEDYAKIHMHTGYDGNDYSLAVPVSDAKTGSLTIAMNTVHLIPDNYMVHITPKFIQFEGAKVKYYHGAENVRKK